MAETYCGRSCGECTQRESMNCPGCKIGPGRQLDGGCTLAQCCREKGHKDCTTCGFRGGCGMLRRRDKMADDRRRKQEQDERKQAAIAKRSRVLGKWIWILFWLVIPSEIAGLMTNETVVSWFPGLEIPGSILEIAVSIAYALILLYLGHIHDCYRTAGICTLIGEAFSLLILLIPTNTNMSVLILLATVPAVCVSVFGEYNEYMAHSDVLADVDRELSEKWNVLWKWYVGTSLALLCSLLLVFISPVLGGLVMIASGIGVIVVGIMKLVYLYRTAKVFREYKA